MRIVDIAREPVELYKILKFESMANSGGQAKLFIDDGLVKVNGEVETRKRKKILSGDVIELFDHVIKVQLVAGVPAESTPAEEVKTPKPKPVLRKVRALLKPFKM